jgi:hypothetical protein
VGHIGRYAEHFAGAYINDFSIDLKTQPSVENVRNLLIDVAMLGDDDPFL